MQAILEIEQLAEMCRFYGERFDLTQAAGGNISVKFNDLMFIKASGVALSSVTEESGYATIDNKELRMDVEAGRYGKITAYNDSIMGPRGSMETYMHSFLPKYVVHLHPIQVNSILVQKDARKICQKLFPNALFLDYVAPGVKLAKKLRKEWKGQNFILLANHGIIATSDSLAEVKKIVKQALKVCEKYLDTSFDRYDNVNKISSIIMSLTGEPCVTYLSEANSNGGFIFEGSMFPDKIIFCGSKFLFTDKLTKQVFQNFIDCNGYAPKVVRYSDDTYLVGKSINQCRDAEAILLANASVYSNGRQRALTATQEKELINMDAEKYRSNLKA